MRGRDQGIFLSIDHVLRGLMELVAEDMGSIHLQGEFYEILSDAQDRIREAREREIERDRRKKGIIE